jgi:tRNA threonylcarbamoyladenosine biosynthesis protein TsaB
MMVLAIDTCGATGSIALGRVGQDAIEVLAQTVLAGKTYSAQLVPVLREMLEKQGLIPGDLQAIVVVNGPGSFTGIRIGVSTAKGLSEALGIPVVAVSRLAVLAWKAGADRAALDAGRGEFYFRDREREFLLAAHESQTLEAELTAICEPAVRSAFSKAEMVEVPTAQEALSYAAPRLQARDFADVETLDGNYVRRSDAELFAKAAGKA